MIHEIGHADMNASLCQLLSSLEIQISTLWRWRKKRWSLNSYLDKELKGSPMHIAPTCTWSGEGPTTLDLMYAVFSCISVRNCFQDLNPWPHGHKATALPLRQGSPFRQRTKVCKISYATQGSYINSFNLHNGTGFSQVKEQNSRLPS
jgi:hypothetical protein